MLGFLQPNFFLIDLVLEDKYFRQVVCCLCLRCKNDALERAVMLGHQG